LSNISSAYVYIREYFAKKDTLFLKYILVNFLDAITTLFQCHTKVTKEYLVVIAISQTSQYHNSNALFMFVCMCV